MKNLKIGFVSLAILMSISACSGTAVPSVDQAGADACAILTQALAESVIGAVSQAPTVNRQANFSECRYSSEGSKSVSLLVRQDFGTPANAKESFDVSRGLSGVEPVKVEELGDGAYWAGGALNQMNVFKNGNWLILSLRIKGEDAKSLATDLAKQILVAM